MVDRRDATEEEVMDRYLSGLGRRGDRPDLPQEEEEEEEEDRSFLTFPTFPEFPESCDVMNQARFVFDEFDESVIPETPSPCRTSGVAGGPPSRGAGSLPSRGAVSPPSRGAGCRSKRRRLLEEDSDASLWQMSSDNHPHLHPTSFTQPSCCSSSSSSSSSSSYSSIESLLMREQHLLQAGRVSEFEARCTRAQSRMGPGALLGGRLDSPSEAPSVGGRSLLEGLQGPAPPQSRKRGKRGARPSPSPSPSPGGSSLSFLTAEERRWVNGEQLGAAAGPLVDVCRRAEEEAVVRTLQLEEDEATARRLQDQFDQEEAGPQQAMGNPYLPTGWTPASSSLQGVMAAFQDELIGRPRGRGRSRAAGRRNRTRPDLSEDLEGNDYEALLRFEEQQGSVVNRKLMSRQQIDRFPTRTFSPAPNAAPNAAAAQCHICFCDYADRDQLRMLSCFHDYHVACIDRWLKDNGTCPICRADMTES